MPSARSVAFRRDALEAVGGYPEWLAIGEDMWVNHRWRERPLRCAFAPEAVALWHPRAFARRDLDAVLRSTRAVTRRPACIPSATRCGSPCTAGSLRRSSSRRTWPKLLAAGGAARLRPHAGAPRPDASPATRVTATLVIPALLAFTDVAKMYGYALGLADRLSGAARDPTNR